MDSDMDTHLCLVCQQTIVGLMNYVTHKKEGCQKKAPPAPRPRDSHQPPQFDGDGQLYAQQPYASGGGTTALHGPNNYSLPNNTFLSPFQQDGQFSGQDGSGGGGAGGYSHNNSHNSQHTPRGGGAADHAYPVPGSGQSSSGLDVDVTSPLSSFIESAFSPGANSPLDLQGTGSSQSNPDFFQSLELERKGEKSGVETSGRNLRNKRKGLPEEFDMDLPITMILSNLDFSSDEETGVVGFGTDGFDLDSEWTDSRPPQSHTGGKWKPGEGPTTSSGGGAGKPYHPHQPTGGKWKPGQRPSGDSPRCSQSFFCSLCQATYMDKTEYQGHLQSLEHREAEEIKVTGRPARTKPEPPALLVPTRVLDPTSGEMVEVMMAQAPVKSQPGETSVVKRGHGSVAVCRTCDLYFDSVKVYDIHCESKRHKESVDKKDLEMQELMLNPSQLAEQKTPERGSRFNNNAADRRKAEAVAAYIKTEPDFHLCTVCNKSFSRKYEMARHLLTQFHRQRAIKHPKALEMLAKYDKYVIRLCPYQCNICQYYFNRGSDLLEHMESEGHATNCQDLVGPVLCVTCKFTATNSEDVLDHMTSQAHRQSVAANHHVCIIRESHSKITCKYCGVQMHSAVRMKRHIEFRHKDRVEEQQEVLEVCNKAACLAACPECPRVFASESYLRRHFQRKHVIKDKNHVCEMCDKKFFEQSGLDSHNATAYHKRRVRQHKLAKEYRATQEKSGPAKVATKVPAKAVEEKAADKPEKVVVKRKKKKKKKKEENGDETDAEPPMTEYTRGRPKRSAQLPKRYYGSSNSSDETDSDATDVNDDTDAVSQAIETVLEMEKNAASGDPSVAAEISLPQIDGVVDIGRVENVDMDEPLAEIVGEVDAELALQEIRDDEEEEKAEDLAFLEMKIQRRSVVKNMSMFPCYLCDFTGGDMEEVKSHAYEQHPNDIIKCEPCSQVFFRPKHYKVHCAGNRHQKNLNKGGSKLELLVCRFCTKKFTDAKIHELHEEFVHLHNSTEKQISQLCQGRDSVSQLYGEHLKQLKKVAYNARVSCPECGRFLQKNGLIEHLRIHTGEKPFKCRHCTKAFSSPLTLRRHLQEHIGVARHLCKECNKSFKKHHLYLRHLVMHENEKKGLKFDCQKCSATFFMEDSLTHHMKRHEDRRFKCTIEGCHWAFVFKAELEEHMYTHTREKKYLCDICGFEAGTKTRIRRHAKAHQPAKTFACEYCPYKAGGYTHLKRHMRIHIGSKPYKCLYCSYECNVAENIRKHILQTRKHQGKHMYPCKFCDYKSNCANAFKQHLHQFHSEYIKEKAYVSLVVFTGLYRPELDLLKPEEGAEIHQVKKGRFVKVYDGTRIGATGEAEGPSKKKAKTTSNSNTLPRKTEAESEPNEQASRQPHHSGGGGTSLLSQALVTGSLQSESARSSQPLGSVAFPMTDLSTLDLQSSAIQQQGQGHGGPAAKRVRDCGSDSPDGNLSTNLSSNLATNLSNNLSSAVGTSAATAVSMGAQRAQQAHQAVTTSVASAMEVVYPRGLPWTVVRPSAPPDTWVPARQVVDMVQACRLQDVQVVGGSQAGATTTTTTFINNTSGLPNLLATINVDGNAYHHLEPGMYQVIAPSGTDGAIANVTVLNP